MTLTWEQRKFRDYVKRINDHDNDPSVPHIEFENINSGMGTLNKPLSELQSEKMGIRFGKGDILFGKLRPYLKNWYLAYTPGIAVGDFWVLRSNRNALFAYYLIQTNRFYLISNLSSGSKMPRSDWNLVAAYQFGFPKQIAEESNIGHLFLKLDNLIALQQRKLGLLNALKKGLLQKMFAYNSRKQPLLRFSGFYDSWEQYKLGKLMDVGSVKRIHQSEWKNSGVRFLRARDIVAQSKNEKPTDLLYIDKKKYNEYSKICGKVSRGDLLVTGVGSIGVPLLIQSNDPIYFKDGNIIWFKNGNSLNGYYFYYLFISNRVQHFIKKSAGSGTVGTYTIDSGRKTPVIISENKREQEKVGTFFVRIDNFINLQQTIIYNLNTLKNSLLQKMFI